MSTWSKDELEKIAAADDLHIAPLRDDRKTYGTPTWIWSVAMVGALYVRAYHGKESRWYQAALSQKAGRIIAAGVAAGTFSTKNRIDVVGPAGLEPATRPL